MKYEFSRIYSLPTPKCMGNDNIGQFRQYSRWLEKRNELIEGFTKHDDKYYMVANRNFYHYYFLYGFCSECGILRCSPVWCICGHKELSHGWTNNNMKLDEFIRKSQIQTNLGNEPYLEWIPFDFVDRRAYGVCLHSHLPVATDYYVKLIPLEIANEMDDLNCDKVNYDYKIY